MKQRLPGVYLICRKGIIDPDTGSAYWANEFHALKGKRVFVLRDPAEMDCIQLFSADDNSYLCWATRYSISPEHAETAPVQPVQPQQIDHNRLLVKSALDTFAAALITTDALMGGREVKYYAKGHVFSVRKSEFAHFD